MLKLRDYQQSLRNAMKEAWKTVRVILAVLATGGGKTVTFAAEILNHRGASAAVVHRKEIVTQISIALASLGVKHRVVAPPQVITRIRRKHLKKFGKCFVDPHAMCGVVSIQSLTSRGAANNESLMSWVKQVTLAVFDEGHHYVKRGAWARGMDLFKLARVLLVTATPKRADGLGLGVEYDGYAEVMIEGPGVYELQKEGWLTEFTYKAPASDFSVDDIPLTASGDFNVTELRKRVVKSHLVGDVVNHYFEFLDGKRALVFATDVLTAQEMASEFVARGVKAIALHGGSDTSERDNAIDDFEDGKIQVLVNVDLFDEGFDVPAADGVILARPTESLAKFMQMIGRVLRVVFADGFDLETVEGRLAAIAASSKPFAVVVDPVNNWMRHGMPNWPKKWTLAGEEKGSRRSDVEPQKICKRCTQPYRAYLLACKYCGYVNPATGRSSPEQVDGCLVDLDVDAMAALFQKIQKANMTTEEFQLDQIRRRVPDIGKGAELNRHNAAKYRRQVLRELMGWWTGCQQGRPLGEIQKRFYYRFGVDMATALTLNRNDTDALIDIIQKRFQEDITDVYD